MAGIDQQERSVVAALGGLPDLVEVEADFGVGVEREARASIFLYSALRTDIYFSWGR